VGVLKDLVYLVKNVLYKKNIYHNWIIPENIVLFLEKERGEYRAGFIDY
jgi:hypothetical protein